MEGFRNCVFLVRGYGAPGSLGSLEHVCGNAFCAICNNTHEHTTNMMVAHDRVLPSDIVAILACISVLCDVPKITTMG